MDNRVRELVLLPKAFFKEAAADYYLATDAIDARLPLQN
jgi:hypothetical protein